MARKFIYELDVKLHIVSSRILGGKRSALLVGINEYADPELQQLRGATNDALEISHLLQTQGNFDVSILTDRDATYEKMRYSIGSLLLSADPSSLVIFYFSGYGVIDGYGNAYLAPYNFIFKNPYINGLNLRDLGNTINSFVTSTTLSGKTVCLIIDCVTSKNIIEKGTGIDEEFLKTFEMNLLHSGTFIIQSTSTETVTKEIPYSTHVTNGSPHIHGAFTYNLIRGLEGAASSQNGIVTLDSLRTYIQKEMKNINKEVKISVQGESRVLSTPIVIQRERLGEYVENLKRQYLDFNEKDIFTIKKAAKAIEELASIFIDEYDANEYRKKIAFALTERQNDIGMWLLKNLQYLHSEIEKQGLDRFQIDNLGLNLDYQRFISIDDTATFLLANVCDLINNNKKRGIEINSIQEIRHIVRLFVIADNVMKEQASSSSNKKNSKANESTTSKLRRLSKETVEIKPTSVAVHSIDPMSPLMKGSENTNRMLPRVTIDLKSYYEKSHAIIIGISKYKEEDSLPNAYNDAKGIMDILQNKYEFDNIIPLFNEAATYAKLREIFIDFIQDQDKVGPKDRLLVYYAGHGKLLVKGGYDSTESKRGYIVPHDAKKGRYSSYFEMNQIIDSFLNCLAKHIFLILDCCYSGHLALRGEQYVPRNITTDYIQNKMAKRALQVLAAGEEDEPVSDSGVRPGYSAFTAALLEILDREPVLESNVIFGADEIGNILKKEIVRHTIGRPQFPVFRHITGSNLGDFAFKIFKSPHNNT